MAPNKVHSAVVIGGGLCGLSTLYHLAKLGAASPLLVERFQLGHDRGSSHGPSRIARTMYPHAGYVRMMKAAFADGWPELERQSGDTLVYRTPGCFFGPPTEPFESYARAVIEAGATVERFSAHRARALFPQLRFSDAQDVLFDSSAALIASARVLRALERCSRKLGAEIRVGVDVEGIDLSQHPIRIQTSRGALLAERVVIAAGPWTVRLVPELASRLTVLRQTVAYFDVEGPPDDYRVPRFPIWAWIGPGDGDFYYGMPEFDHPGVKLARHVTRGLGDDPEAPPGTFEEDAIEDLRAFAHREFAPSVRGLAGADTCLYTCTSTENFILDKHPGDPRVVVGAGFSGHGFKFGPVIGRALAELAMNERCEAPEYLAMRSEFAWGATWNAARPI